MMVALIRISAIIVKITLCVNWHQIDPVSANIRKSGETEFGSIFDPLLTVKHTIIHCAPGASLIIDVSRF
jgi:hypothetical protein